MASRASIKINAPSSLRFVGGILFLHFLLAGVWVAAPLLPFERFCGLISSFVATLIVARRWWGQRLAAYDRELARLESCEIQQKAMSSDLQQMMVDHLHFTMLTFDEQLTVRLETPSFPKSLSEIDDLNGFNLIKMLGLLTQLSPDVLRMLQFQLRHVFGMDSIQWSATSLSFPREARLRQARTAFARLTYIPIYQQGKLAQIHLIMQDVSEIKEREVKAEQQRKDMEKFFALLQVSDSLFELFMSETRKLFEEIKYDLKSLRGKSSKESLETANRMFRAVHTIKANGKLFKMSSIEEVAHSVETYLEELRSGKRHFTPAVLAELTQKIMSISEEIYSYASMRKEILNASDRNSSFNMKYRVQWIRSLMNQFASIMRDPNFERRHLQLIQKEFGRALTSFDKVSLREYLKGYNQMLQEVAASLGKEVGEIDLDLEYHHFDSSSLARINDILLHCLRNSIDHGIETVEQRLAVGKPRQGRIYLKTTEVEGTVKIEVGDDGQGLDLERIKAKAVELQIINQDQAERLSDMETIPLLFHTGVSTATQITEISGRGLGMDVVRDYVQSLGGQLNISSIKGQSTSLSFLIPSVTEDMVAPLGIYDLREIVQEVLTDYLAYAKERYEFHFENQKYINIFSDKIGLVEILRLIFTDLHLTVPASSKIVVHVTEHLGRRRVDSYVFYRMTVTLEGGSLPPQWVFEKTTKNLEVASTALKKSGGSLYMREPKVMEINVPSNIPVRFSEYEFKVLIFTERLVDVQSQIDSFFEKIMGSWKFKSFHYPFSGELPLEVKDVPCLVLLDSGLVKLYVEMRDENDRRKDGVVLFPEEELDIDTLNGSSILPENILFVPPSFDEKHFHRSLAGVIFRRFLKEMVRGMPNTEDQGEEVQERMAS